MPKTPTVTTTLAALALCATVAQTTARAADRQARVERPSLPASLELDAAYQPDLGGRADGAPTAGDAARVSVGEADAPTDRI